MKVQFSSLRPIYGAQYLQRYRQGPGQIHSSFHDPCPVICWGLWNRDEASVVCIFMVGNMLVSRRFVRKVESKPISGDFANIGSLCCNWVWRRSSADSMVFALAIESATTQHSIHWSFDSCPTNVRFRSQNAQFCFFRKTSHLQPLEWLQVAANGRKWPQAIAWASERMRFICSDTTFSLVFMVELHSFKASSEDAEIQRFRPSKPKTQTCNLTKSPLETNAPD